MSTLRKTTAGCVSNFHIQLDPTDAVIDSLLAEKGR